MGIYSNDYQTTLGDMSNPLRLSGIYGNSAYDALYSNDPTEPGLFKILGGLVNQGANSMKDNLRASLKDRAITPYANDLTKLTAMKDKTGDFQFLKNNMTSNLSGLEDWLLDARRDNGINTAIDTVNTNEGVSWLDNYKASVSGMPVNDVLHGAKNLDSLYDLAGKGRTGGEMLNVKESANKAVQNQLTDWLKPEIQSAVGDAALRGEIVTPAAIINSGGPIIRDILIRQGVDPRIANNRKIIDPVKDSLLTQYTAATGGNGLKPEDVKAFETKTYAANKANSSLMNATDYNARKALSSLTDAEAIALGFASKEEAIKNGTSFMQQRFMQNPVIMDFREKMQNGDKSYLGSPEFIRALTLAEEFDRANGTSGNNSMVTLITGQANYKEQWERLARVVKPTSEEDKRKQAYLYEALNFYNNNQDKGKYNFLRTSSLNGVTEEGLTSMKDIVKGVARGNKVTLNDTQIDNAVEYLAYVLGKDDIKVTFRGVDKPAFKGNNDKWNRVSEMLGMYILGTAVTTVPN